MTIISFINNALILCVQWAKRKNPEQTRLNLTIATSLSEISSENNNNCNDNNLVNLIYDDKTKTYGISKEETIRANNLLEKFLNIYLKTYILKRKNNEKVIWKKLFEEIIQKDNEFKNLNYKEETIRKKVNKMFNKLKNNLGPFPQKPKVENLFPNYQVKLTRFQQFLSFPAWQRTVKYGEQDIYYKLLDANSILGLFFRNIPESLFSSTFNMYRVPSKDGTIQFTWGKYIVAC